jgi:hypothetical protein
VGRFPLLALSGHATHLGECLHSGAKSGNERLIASWPLMMLWTAPTLRHQCVAAVATEIAVAEIIDHHEDDIAPRLTGEFALEPRSRKLTRYGGMITCGHPSFADTAVRTEKRLVNSIRGPRMQRDHILIMRNRRRQKGNKLWAS